MTQYFPPALILPLLSKLKKGVETATSERLELDQILISKFVPLIQLYNMHAIERINNYQQKWKHFRGLTVVLQPEEPNIVNFSIVWKQTVTPWIIYWSNCKNSSVLIAVISCDSPVLSTTRSIWAAVSWLQNSRWGAEHSRFYSSSHTAQRSSLAAFIILEGCFVHPSASARSVFDLPINDWREICL